jgi:hypothetical protein
MLSRAAFFGLFFGLAICGLTHLRNVRICDSGMNSRIFGFAISLLAHLRGNRLMRVIKLSKLSGFSFPSDLTNSLFCMASDLEGCS